MRYLLPLVLLLGACTKTITVEKPVLVNVPVRAVCPAEDEAKRLKSERPSPLRNSPMPSTDVERVAKTTAQLGKYEAEGGWADQVVSALNRCQEK